MIETRLGKRKSLALSIVATALLCLIFTEVTSDAMMLLTSMGISLTTTVMWAILYGYVIESRILDVNVRICSADFGWSTSRTTE